MDARSAATDPSVTGPLPSASSFRTLFPKRPLTEGSDEGSWSIRWRRITSATVERNRPAADDRKRAPGNGIEPDAEWMRSSASDPLEDAYRTLRQSCSLGTRYCTLRVSELEGSLKRELWLFDLEEGLPLPDMHLLTEAAWGSFDFESLFPWASTSARALAKDASHDVILAHDCFLEAAHELVLRALHDQMRRSEPLRTLLCGSGLLVASQADRTSTPLFCRPTVSLTTDGLQITIDTHPISYRPVSDLTESPSAGSSIILAPLGLTAAYVRTVHESRRPGDGFDLVEMTTEWVVARLQLLPPAIADVEEVSWPAPLCLAKVEPEGCFLSDVLNAHLDKDRFTSRLSLENKQTSAAHYIEVVAKERDKERRERALAVAKQQFGVATPSSAVNTPKVLGDDSTIQTPGTVVPPTPASLGLDGSVPGNASQTSSPVATRQLGGQLATATAESYALEPSASMDWAAWPVNTSNFDDPNAGFEIGLNDADFSFFDEPGEHGDAHSKASTERHLAEQTSAPALADFGQIPSPQFLIDSSSAPFDPINASSTSAESPSGRTPRTPFTPFTNNIDTEQTDQALPSPAVPHSLSFPISVDPGFGAIDFDEDDNTFMPPLAQYCSKHCRSQAYASSPEPTKPLPNGKNGLTLSQRFRMAGRPSQKAHHACLCGMSSLMRSRGSEFEVESRMTPHESVVENDADMLVDDSVSDESSDGESGQTADILPLLSSSLLRLHSSGARVVRTFSSIEPVLEPSFVFTMKGIERLRFEFFLGALTECLLHSFPDSPAISSAQERQVMGTLASKVFTPGPRPTINLVRHPKIRCCRRDGVIDLDMSALPFWQKLELVPWSDRKDVTAFMLDMLPDRFNYHPSMPRNETLLRCVRLLGEKYEALGLGSHMLGAADNEVIKQWPSDRNAEGIKDRLRKLGKSMMSSGLQARRTVVLYLVGLPSCNSIIEQIHLIHGDIFAAAGLGAPLFQFLPGSSISELEAALCGPIDSDASRHWPNRIAFAVYERQKASVARLRLHPEGMPESKWTKPQITPFSPAIILAKQRATPHFTFAWPPRHLNLFDRGRLLHVVYCVSDDWQWFAIATMDDRAEDRLFRPAFIGAANEPMSTRVKRVADLVARFIVEIAATARVEWSIVLLRLGPCSSEELFLMKDRLGLAIGLCKTKQDVEITFGALQPAGPKSVQRALPATFVRESAACDLCIVRNAGNTIASETSPLAAKTAVPALISTASATVAQLDGATWRSLFVVDLYHRAASPAYPSTLSASEHEQQILESLVHLTVLWRARNPARDARTLPWHADVAAVFCEHTVRFVQHSPASLFIP